MCVSFCLNQDPPFHRFIDSPFALWFATVSSSFLCLMMRALLFPLEKNNLLILIGGKQVLLLLLYTYYLSYLTYYQLPLSSVDQINRA